MTLWPGNNPDPTMLSCPHCTFVNKQGATLCAVCGLPLAKASGPKHGGTGTTWSCLACTMLNEGGVCVCAVCGTERPGSNSGGVASKPTGSDAGSSAVFNPERLDARGCTYTRVIKVVEA